MGILIQLLANMPASGFPLVLEKALDALFQDHSLTSWTIRGGLFTTVTLKFNTQNGDQGQQKVSTPKTYRSKPPSSYNRDFRRRQMRYGNNSVSNVQSQNGANDSGFNRSEDADLQASDTNCTNTLVKTCNVQEKQNIDSQMLGELVCENDSDPVVNRSTISSTTGQSMSKQTESSSHMVMSHMTPIQSPASELSMKQRPVSKLTDMKRDNSLKCTQSAVGVTSTPGYDSALTLTAGTKFPWIDVYYTEDEDMCHYCNEDNEIGEKMKECTCARKERICLSCFENQKFLKYDDNHVCTKPYIKKKS